MNEPISIKRVVLTSFGVDVLDVVLNLAVALLTGSIVMVAELTQGASDLAASGFLLIGIARPKKEMHIWTLISAVFMLLVASSLSFSFGLQRFLHPQPIENIFIAYTALIISIVSNGYALFVSIRRLLKKGASVKSFIREFRSSRFIMTKNAFVLDLMGMSSALVGFLALVLYQTTGELRFDGIGAMAIGVVLGLLSLMLIFDIIKMPKNIKQDYEV